MGGLDLVDVVDRNADTAFRCPNHHWWLGIARLE